ncbi:hypothetical protein [uncultured Brevibacillus sp.]|uniref:hypothetical protein n=1 Tax=uncultured Brevibacillus sp. TaxID=169970 RepID=UPI002593B6E4|nr:hypothetical protein [uncultured Brevibacillus sp.]
MRPDVSLDPATLASTALKFGLTAFCIIIAAVMIETVSLQWLRYLLGSVLISGAICINML